MTTFLAQIGRLTPVQQAVKDQFEHGGSSVEVFVIIVTLVALVIAAGRFSLRPRGVATRAGAVNDPKGLFDSLLGKLTLPEPQRRILRIVARDLELVHPTVILLSPESLDRAAKRWMARTVHSTKAVRRQRLLMISRARRALFPGSG